MAPARRAFVLLLLAIAVSGMVIPPVEGASTVGRSADPVVLSGADVPSLLGASPTDLVAWRYDAGWLQIPLQVDERDVVDWGTIYDTDPIGVTALVYTDPGTFTGADSAPLLDANDELVFTVRDAGALPPGFDEPPGVVAGTGVEIEIFDPLDGGLGYVYLFRQDGAGGSETGPSYVVYDFNLLSGDYLTTYSIMNGPNPEDSLVSSAHYAHHFSDRWIDDEMMIFSGGASGVDVLDRHKNQFAPGNCARTEDTFSNGEGVFVVNKSGPVRAIRSYLGANSGPLTQREHLFYERRHDIRTILRVHAISGVVDYFDYSPAAIGMSYYNDRNTGGVTIDGLPDTVEPGSLSWEMVEGEQGTLIVLHELDTDITGLNVTSYYLDTLSPLVTQCTGDGAAYGASGPRIDSPIPCTDPSPQVCPGVEMKLTTARRLYYEPPGTTIATAAARHQQALVPLTLSVAGWPPPSPGRIPNGEPEGPPLTVAKEPGETGRLEIDWGVGCVSGVDYAVYEGSLGTFESHAPVDCSVAGLTLTLTPGDGDRYYLVVPVSEWAEGSYGVDSGGTERPSSASACAPRVPGECP